MFDKTLVDLVKGIRANKRAEAAYIAQCIAEVKQELKSPDMDKKVLAIQKLTYLNMIGYDISFSAFQVVEMMSHPKFAFKRIGYLAASQSFTPQTDVLLLTHNQFKKDLTSQNQYESGLAINALSNIATPDLSRDLISDVVNLLNSSKVYVKKKAILVLFKMFVQYPEALRPAFPRLKEKLDEQDVTVVGSAVNVLVELARKNPKNYLALAPIFFKLLTTVTNNWTLIKIIKLFGELTPLEPRLSKKLVEPMTNIINTTPAKSLLYECLHTVSVGMTEHLPIVRLAVEKLKGLVEDSDQNLKYLGLLGLSNIIKAHPKVVADLRETIVKCLEDDDVTIRYRALDLLCGIINKKNMQDIVRKLIDHARQQQDDANGTHYRLELVEKIITTCSAETYQYVTNFKWYISILMEFADLPGLKIGKLLASQLMDVAIRVRSIRSHAVKAAFTLLNSSNIINDAANPTSDMSEVLYAAAWISGEFASWSKDLSALVSSLLHPRLSSLKQHIQAACVQASLKAYAAAARTEWDEDESEEDSDEEDSDDEKEEPPASLLEPEERAELTAELRETIRNGLKPFLRSPDVEVQERASTCLHVIEFHDKMLATGVDVGSQIASLFFAEELNPVAAKAQKKVPVPEGLDLDAWINEPESPSSSESEVGDVSFSHASSFGNVNNIKDSPASASSSSSASASASKAKAERVRRDDPYLLGSSASSSAAAAAAVVEQVESIPLVTLTKEDLGLDSDDDKKSRKGKKKGKKSKKDAEPVHKVSIKKTEDFPEGGSKSDEEKAAEDDSLASIDLTKPLNSSEVLPTAQHYKRLTREEVEAQQMRERAEAARLAKKSSKSKKEDGAEGEKKDKKKKSKKDENGEAEKKEKKSKKDKKEEVVAPAAAAVVVEAGKKEKKSSKKEEKSKPKKGGVDGLLDEMFGDVASSVVPAASSISPPAGQVMPFSPTSNQSYMNNVPAAIEEDKSSRKKDKKKSSKEEEKEEKKSSRSSKKDKSAATPAPAAAPSSAAAMPQASPAALPGQLRSMRPRLVVQDENMTVMLNPLVQPTDANHITIPLTFGNTSFHNISSLTIDLTDTMNTKLVRQIPGPIRAPFTLPPQNGNSLALPLYFGSLTRPQNLPGTITYNIQKDGQAQSHTLTFNLVLPCSMFIIPLQVPSAEFQAALEASTFSASARIKLLAGMDVQSGLNEIAAMLRLRILEVAQSAAHLYGRSVQNHHVAALIKAKSATEVQIDVKSSDEALAANLIKEAQSLFAPVAPIAVFE